nr:TlpA disulfide reductase family protein [Propionicimonas sp.]
MRSSGAARAVAGVACAVLLAGCGQLLPGVGGGTPSVPGAPAETPTDLVAARKAAGIEDCPASSKAAAVPGGLPDLTLDCLGGDSSVRLAGLRGPMLINLWAQWCEPCRAEAGHLATFATKQKKVAVLGINYSDPQPALAIEFAQLVGATYPQLSDEEHRLKAPLGVAGIPYTLLIDADGKVVARHPGQFVSLENVEEWVAKGLSG